MQDYLIKDKATLKEYLEYEKQLYLPDMNKHSINRMKRLHWKRYQIWRCMVYLRKAEYYYYQTILYKNIKHKVAAALLDFFTKKKNKACEKVDLELNLNMIGKGTDIWHGSVVINGIVGENCCFHGTNTLGIKSNLRNSERPVLGNRVDIGIGSMVVGNIYIADDCIIGAGAVVTKSCYVPGTILVGVPAKPLEQQKEVNQ